MNSTDIPLSNLDIQQKVNCKFYPYEFVNKINNINDFLPKSLILYQLAEIGHFVCIFQNKEGINFFDSYGYKPDEQLNFMPDELKKKLKHDYTYIIRLLLNQPYPIIYNEYKLQKLKASTCGHWCTIRLIYSDLTNDEFASVFKNVKDKDKLIVKLFNSV